jgi:hypothetical protein
MADKTPLRLVLDRSNNPTGLAEFQSGETIGNSFLTNSGNDSLNIDITFISFDFQH